MRIEEAERAVRLFCWELLCMRHCGTLHMRRQAELPMLQCMDYQLTMRVKVRAGPQHCPLVPC